MVMDLHDHRNFKRSITIISLIAVAVVPNVAVLALGLIKKSVPGESNAIIPVFIAVSLFNIFYALVAGLMAVRRTHGPLRELTLAVEQIAGGNLHAPIECKGTDEIVALAESISKIRDMMSSSFDAIGEHVAELQDRVAELKFITGVDSAILKGQHLDSIFDLITEQLCELTKADYSCITLLEWNDRLKIESLHGFSPEERRLFSSGLIGKSMEADTCPSMSIGEIIALGSIDMSDLNPGIKEIYKRLGAVSMMAAPLSSGGRSIGSVIIWHKEEQDFTEFDFNRFRLFADQTSVAIKSATLVSGIRSLTLEIMRALAKAIDARDSYTANHSERVSKLAVALAQELGFSEQDIQTIEYAGLLHDIGKIGIDERILNKPGALTEEEMEIMKNHSIMSANIIKPIEFLKDVVPIVIHHHEWFNGRGYPYGLSGEDIPIGARILAIADALEAMTSTRPYRSELPMQEGAHRLDEGSGVQFDPDMVEAMLRVIARLEFVESFDEFGDVGDSDTSLDSVV